MRYILIFVTFLGCIGYSTAQTVTQPGLRDYQLSGAALPDSILYIMGTDTTDGSSKQGLGKWHRGDSLINALGDHDFYGLGTGRPAFANEDSIETADTMYILLHGLKGGLHSKIEFLKESKIRFDWPEEGDGSVFDYLTVKPVQQSQDNTNWNEGVFTASGAGDRWNNVHYEGWNLLGGAREDASSTAVGLFIEDHYDLNTDNIKSEIIFAFIDSSGTQWRPFWMNIDKKYREDWTAIFTNVVTSFTSSINGQPYIQLNTSADTVSSIIRMTSPKSNDTKGVEFEWNQGTNQLGLTPFGTSNSTFNITLPYTTTVALRRTSDTRVDNGLTMTDLAATSAGGYFGTALIDGTLDFNSSTLSVDTSIIATQYDLTTVGGTDTDDQNLTIEGAGPTYDIAINDGTDVTIANLYGLTLSESPANTLNFQVDTSKLATQYDISGFGTMSNWLLAASGTGGTETVTNGETVTFAETTGLDATRSTNTVSYALSIDEYTTDSAPEGDELGLFYDPSGTNHELVDISELLNVVEEGNVSVQSDNMNLDFQSMFDVAADGAGEVNISFDGGEATTVTTAESDDYLLMHDSGLSQNQKMLWSDFVIDIIGFEEDNVNEGNGNTFDFGTGLDLSVTGAEADVSLDFNEFTTDAATEGDEYVILYDPSAADEEKVLITSLGGSDTNFAEDDLTFTGSRTHDMGVNSLTLTGTATNVYIQEENGGSGNMLVLVSELGAGTGITGGISFQSENSGTPTEQYDVESYKWSTNQSTFKISGEQATDAEIVYEKNADLADNTTESHLSINGGIAFTQNYDGSTGGNDLSVDRSYYNINITGGNLTDTIKLPEVASTTDNWSSSLSSTQCQVGQEYVISNLRSGVNLVIGAYNPAGTSDDLIGTRTAPGGSAGSAISIAPGKSVIVKCYQLAGGIGYWNYWLSN